MSGLADFLARCEGHPGRTAIVDGRGAAISYGALARRSAATAAAWRRRGLQKGDRVLLAMPLGIDLYVALAGLWRLGAVVVFPEPAMGLAGVRHAVETARPRALLAGGWYGALRVIVPELWRVPMVLSVVDGPQPGDPLAAPAAGDAALISFTSGSTGKPKAIVRTHAFLAAQNAAVGDFLAPEREGTTDLVAFPVFVLASLSLGLTAVLPGWNVRRHDEADAGVIARQITERRIDRLLVPPSICETLAASDVSSPVSAIFTGGGPVFPDLIQALCRRFPRAQIAAVYGSTEAEPIAHVAASDIGASDWQAMAAGKGLLAGRPAVATRVAIRDHEIVVSGPHVNKGYLDPAQDASTKLAIDGQIWHRTGDAGRLDDAGRLWLLGRLDGRVGPLFPFAVEAAARTWPGVQRAALCATAEHALLAIEGDRQHAAAWRARSEEIGVRHIRVLDRIPLDKRHRSKVDYPALRALVGQEPQSR